MKKKKLIFQREQYYINLVEPEYNIVRTIGDGEGREYPMKVRLQMRISNAASNKIYCYNKDGSFYKTFYSMLEAGSHLNINRRTISFRLKQSNPVHLKNKLETESYILSTFSLTQNDLDEFFASSEGLAIASSQKIREGVIIDISKFMLMLLMVNLLKIVPLKVMQKQEKCFSAILILFVNMLNPKDFTKESN